MTIDINNVSQTLVRNGERSTSEHVDKQLQNEPSHAERSNSKETVHLTDRSQDIEKMKKTLAELPVVDNQKVAEIRQAIADGNYKINSHGLAERLIQFEQQLTPSGE